MNFLYPSFLLGLLSVSVPIAIHLFNFRRTRRVFFSNVALLRTVQTETKSFRRLKHWLILACRCLFLACLVLAFAQPFIPSKNKLGLSRQGVTSLYVDNSYSMQNERNTKRYLDIAISKLDELLTLFRNATSLQLLTNDFSVAEQQAGTAEAVRDRVTSIRFAHTPRTFETVYRRQRNLLSSLNPGGRNQLFWFSDFQKSTAGDLSRLKIDTTDRLFIVPLDAQATKNVYVDSVWLSTPFIREMQNNSLNVKLNNAGRENVKNLPVRLYLDDTQTSTATATLTSDGSATVALNFNVTSKGYHRGRIVFEDYPITFDNQYFFVIEASPAVRILHLYEQKSGPADRTSDYINAVYSNDSLFVRQSFSVQNFDVGQLKETDLVVLEGVSEVNGTLRTELERFVRQGGSLAIIPPANPNSNSYTPFLQTLGVGTVQVTGTSGTTPTALPVADPDRRNPFFQDVFQQSYQSEPLNMPTAAPVWRWSSGQRLLSLRDGSPLLTQTRLSGGTTSRQGSVYVLASPLASNYGNLAEHALFVPIMYKMAALSVRAQRTAYSFDDNLVTISVSNPSEKAIYKLKHDKLEIIPVQRIVGNQLQLEMPKSNELAAGQEVEAGYYELRLNDKTERLLAFNHGNQESTMSFYSADELRKIFATQPNVEIFDSIQDGDFVQVLEQENLGKSLWKYFLIAALAFMLLEVGLVRFMKG
ncbi:BatA domain-containing protein [Spirosoma fluviale]|uniref:N-terminal double-transmembrane domain-containing protein n=1 Tax=Spirosoma fluviale TaxID=1597977 RepID=A0A286GSL2_9BACT|nr:BatA domain-containing protein [Spirosoma fluviale]SOD98557.1 N-terminal double-transmembrane domain-containing protein [Spirosoma fluviale]